MTAKSPRASGLYGLFSLDGRPVAVTDAKALGLPLPKDPVTAIGEGIDPTAPSSIHYSDSEGELILFVGDVDEVHALAGRLGLSSDGPLIEVVRTALGRFGPETPAEMLGEWSLACWSRERRLTLMTSAALRDQLFFSIRDNRAAVAPDLCSLARLTWVGRDIDEAGLLFRLGRAAVRERAGGSTMLKNVRRLGAGQSVTADLGKVRFATAGILKPQARWKGTFEDAVMEAEALLRTIMRERAERHASPAVLLSGGLDSSLLAWALAEQLGADQPMHLITSVAPSGSGLADESGFAGIVAAALGRTCIGAAAASDVDAYRPPRHVMLGSNGPMLTNRAPLTDAYQQAAREAGATVLINGTYGELTVTGRPRFGSLRQRLRATVGRIVRGRQRAVRDPVDDFHVRLAPHRLARLPEAIRLAAAASPAPRELGGSGNLWGYHEGVGRMLGHPNEFYPGALRMDFPYRDIRLLRLFAGWPMGFFARDGLDRAPVRHILKGRLPESIWMRTRGMPAWPDQMARLKQQAGAARERIPHFRKAEVGEWLDLDWLDQSLERVAVHGPAGFADANAVQLTAVNAEFLTWFRTTMPSDAGEG
jgi:asparagine synthase (glutamine-hydrolysing)